MKKSRRNFVKRTALGITGLALGIPNIKASSIGSILGVVPGTNTGEVIIDLLKDGNDWSTFTPREGITPLFSKKESEGIHNNPTLIIHGNNNPDSMGCWVKELPMLYRGQRYRIECSFRLDQIKNINNSIRALVFKNKNPYAFLYMLDKKNGYYIISGEFTPEQDEKGLELRLHLIDSGKGTVQWKRVELKNITETFKPRLVNVAAVSGKPKDVQTPAGAIDYYCNLIDKINAKNLDLVCLGEIINKDGVPGKPADLAETIPGHSSRRLGEKAKEYNTYIVASLLERDGNLIYNTAVLIGRNGQIVGKYHKVHVTMSEQLVWGVKSGNDYPVFQTDFGKVGLMVCYDNHFPEVSRILAVKGADLIAFSNDSDGREWPNGASRGVWDPYIRTRAIDSHVAIVAAVNGGRSAIVNGSGEILATNKFSSEEPGGIIEATVDLNASVINGTGRMIQKRYLLLRHPETYKPLIKHNWDFE